MRKDNTRKPRLTRSTSLRSETKKRIPHILLDTDFFYKPETLTLENKFGSDGPLITLKLLCILMNEQLQSICLAIAEQMLSNLHVNQEKISEIINFLIEIGWLFIDDDGLIYSDRVRSEANRVIKKRKILSANAKQKLSKSSANAKQMQSKSTDTDTDHIINNKYITVTTDLDQSEKDAFVVNYFHGNQDLFEQRFEECIDYIKSHGKQIYDLSAYFRNWLKKHREMTGKDPCVPLSKNEVLTRNERIFKQEQDLERMAQELEKKGR